MLIIEFSRGSPSISFNISSDGSIVLTTTSIDRESIAFFDVTVRVRDRLSHETTASVLVTIEDINDSPPVIQENSTQLDITVPENYHVICTLSSDCVVQNVSATDADEGQNAHFTYAIADHRGVFEIDQFTGRITLSQNLDREQTPFYVVTVTATDAALNADSVTFTITVGNVNDNPPMFSASIYSGSVEEEVPLGTPLSLRVQATDPDENSTVYYGKLPGQDVPFDVNETTGWIFTTGPLDRENSSSFRFLVEADDRQVGSLSPQAIVEITVTDINDHSPIFDSSLYQNDLNEGTMANSIIFQVHAEDMDMGLNAEIEYDIVGIITDRGLADNYFQIDSDTGHISLLRPVTVSATEPMQVNITVEARDKTDPFNSGRTLVVFNVIDNNTITPMFEQVFYEFSVLENVNDTVVGSVLATETSNDQGINAEINYILPDSTPLFTIDTELVSWMLVLVHVIR